MAINQAASQADPANISPINFTVVFSELVSDFVTGDVTLGGTAGATTAIVTGNGTTYNVAVSGMTSDGTVIATLAAGVAHDAAGNASLASTSTDNTVTFLTPTHTWTGLGADNKWSTALNWAEGVAPSAGDNLIFPAGAAQLENFNDYPSGVVFGSVTVSGSGYHFQGNSHQASNFELQPNANVEVNAIYTDTLTLGDGATLTISAIPGGPSAQSALKPLAGRSLQPISTESVSQATLSDTPVQSSSAVENAVSAEPQSVVEPAVVDAIAQSSPAAEDATTDAALAASMVLATPDSTSGEAATTAAPVRSVSDAFIDAVAAPAVIVTNIGRPARLSESSAQARSINPAINNRLPLPAPIYSQIGSTSTALYSIIENRLQSPLAENPVTEARTMVFTSLHDESSLPAALIEKRAYAPVTNSRQVYRAALQTIAGKTGDEADFDITPHVHATKHFKQFEKAVDTVLAEEDKNLLTIL